MLVELLGPTSAGKSAWLEALARRSAPAGTSPSDGPQLRFHDADQIVLDALRMGRLSNTIARSLAIDLATGIIMIQRWSRDRARRELLIDAVRRPQQMAARWERANIVRNAIKKTYGIERLRRLEAGGRVDAESLIVLDEGPLHVAHYLFVHSSVAPAPNLIRDFARLVALPDVAFCITDSTSVIVERVRERKHRRVPDEPEAAAVFVARATQTFTTLVDELLAQERMTLERMWTHGTQSAQVLVRRGFEPPRPLIDAALDQVERSW